ncbi:peptidoglycan-binding protein [Ignatzschineria larvae DSM 13226]|uniref:Peptidoglycan-binding protein n=1 Tax=Ignatzschineria larvae DSM 13226 TaxID=1111732 RepID=A0ABZ3BY69_9GAMM|nr:peptidoglycan-binding protein [Ignatzschineria larvae]
MRKAVLNVALSSLLLLSPTFANSLIDLLKDSQDPKVGSLTEYQDDNVLYFKDIYGFTLYDYTKPKQNEALKKWLETQNIATGVTPEVIQRAQVWLYLLDYPIDNLDGKMSEAFKAHIVDYQKKNNLPIIADIVPEWFIDLEQRAINTLLDEVNKENPNLSDIELQAALVKKLREKLPANVNVADLITLDTLLPATNNKVIFKITPQKTEENPYELMLDLSYLNKTPTTNRTETVSATEISNPLISLFDLSENEIQKLISSARSAKTLTLQTWLKVAGFFPEPLVIDGQAGGNTRSAIIHFQKSINYTPADGVPNVKWEVPLETIVRKEAQKQLQLLGLYEGDIDGRNGTATRNAIKAYEKSIQIPETGTLSPNLLFHLFNSQFLPKEIAVKTITQTMKAAADTAENSTEPVATTATATTIAESTAPEVSEPKESKAEENKTEANNTEITVAEVIETESALDNSNELLLFTPIVQKTIENVAGTPQTTVETQEPSKRIILPPDSDEDEETVSEEDEAALDEADIDDVEFVAETLQVDPQEAKDKLKQLQKIIDLEAPIQLFDLNRTQVDDLLIKAKSSEIFFTQISLYLLGIYDGPLDGANGPATRDAIRTLEKELGQPETGQILPRWQTPLRQLMYRFVQYKLKEDGLYDGAIDGITGTGTRNAIIAYEKANDTEEVGRLTSALLLTLFNEGLNNAVTDAKIPTDSPEDVTDDGTSPVSAEEDQTLKTDSKKEEELLRTNVQKFDLSHPKSKEDTALLQLKLAYLGFLTGDVDGLTGPATTRAITAFQKAFNLPQTGKLDKKTEAKLEEENINKFQRYLQRTDYMKDNPTGTLGPKTRRAIGILKNRYGYKVDNNLDLPAYLILIDEEQNSRFAKDYYEKEIKAREQEQELKDTQAYLVGFGVLNSKVDGKMGPSTEKAIATYRSQQGLKKGSQIDSALIESFKKNAPKQAQAYLQQLGYPIKPDGIFGANSKKQLNAFLTSQRKAKSDIVTATILMDLKQAVEKRLSSKSSSSTASSSTSTPRKTGTAPRLQKGLQKEGILTAAPTRTVNGPLQVIKNGNNIVGCKVKNITMAADWCTGKRNGSSCRVLYKNGRVLSMNCK